MVLVTVDGVPAAVAGLNPLSDDGSELKRMYVQPASRGLGTGRRLIDYVINRLGHSVIGLSNSTASTSWPMHTGSTDRPGSSIARPPRARRPATEWTTTGSIWRSTSAPAELLGGNNERAA
jgi:GNAT superfamily N-acetyltransferase